METLRLQTSVDVPDLHWDLDHTHPIAWMGSCFAENMGQRLKYYRYQQSGNPFGIQYQPLALSQTLKRALQGTPVTSSELYEHNGLHFHWLHHTSLSDPDPASLLVNLNRQLESWADQLKDVRVLLVTLGTAWAYKHLSYGDWVGNCHKVPAKEFEKELLDIDTMAEALSESFTLLRKVNPTIQIGITVSPVRHIRDGIIANQRSKARLIEVAHTLCNAHDYCTYFPAYEIVLDELRDYRYYGRDLVHPSELAVDLIWERFARSALSKEAHVHLTAIDRVQRALAHKVSRPNTNAHEQFVKQTLAQMEQLEAHGITWEPEKSTWLDQLDQVLK